MTVKPTYAELEKKIKKLEKDALDRKRMETAMLESEERFKSTAV